MYVVTSSSPPILHSRSRRSLLSDSSPLSAISATISKRNPLEEDTLSGNEDDSDSEYDDNTTLTASTIMPMDESVELPPPLKASFIEEEVFNTEIGGHNDEELAQDEGNESFVKRISVEDAIHQEKCVVFTDAIMSLLRELHGSICKQQGCGRVLEYRKSYVAACLIVSWILLDIIQ
ncbi:Hypothetical predicted protein [Paramuricea clavata]|uniref:Uncharacterized protein n=1 Tax=Paramuricea clavata TaxID=317549 RepID=A0A7D9DAF6_PARCT|nr:Hypothetical predicted protein [Paramuricea clavata]